MSNPVFVTLFPQAENVHLIKDVGMIPFIMNKYYHYDARLACYENGEYPYLNSEVAGLKLDFLPCNTGNIIEDGKNYLIQEAANIDVLHIFHLDDKSLLWIQTYKSINPKGKIYLKLDANSAIKEKKIPEHFFKALEQCNLVSVETKDLHDYMKNNWPVQVEYLPNGIYDQNIRQDIQYANKENIICTVGRIGAPEKATDLLLEAFKLAAPELPEWKLKLIGPVQAGFHEYLDKFFSDNSELEARIIISGEIIDRKQLKNKYAQAKVFCLTSKMEGFPLAFLEAAINGCFIISSDVAAAWDITNRKQFGDIFETGNSAQLAKSLIENCRDNKLADKCKLIQNYVYDAFYWPTICGALNQFLVTNTNSKKYKVSIVMPVYNKIEYTRQCLQSIVKNTDVSCEIVVINNASTDETKTFLSQLTGDIRSLNNENNNGFVEACNQGAKIAKGEYLVFLNNDTVPRKGWLAELVSTIESDITIGAVGGKLIYPNGQLQEAGGIIFSDGSGCNYGRGDNPLKPQYNYLREVDYCSGACLLIKRELLERIGGFDMLFAPGYYEDTDLCFAVRKLGYKVIYNPKAEIVHHEGITAGIDRSKGMKHYQVINRYKFLKKWEKELVLQYQNDRKNIPMAAMRKQKKNILVVDAFMPMHDRAAGSLRLFMILKLLRQQGYAITFIARNGVNQKRYVDELERLGIEVYATDVNKMKALGCEVSGWNIDFHSMLTNKFYDVAWLSFYDIAEQYLPEIRQFSPATKVIIDTVDVHYLRETRQAALSGNRDLMAKATETKQRELTIYSQADLVVTVTEDDKMVLQQEKIKVPIAIVPTIHDTLIETNYFTKRSGILFVGNFSHTPNIDAINYFVVDIWPLVKTKLPGVKFYIVGNRSEAFCKYDDPDIIVTGFVPDTQPYLQQCRVSVAPLRYGAGMKGKIGEAIASGIPVVTTSIGSEGMHLTNGEHVLVADAPQSFAASIIRLYNDEQLWRQFVDNAKAHINVFCSSQVVAQKLQLILNPKTVDEHHVKLHVGCGSIHLNDFINIDSRDTSATDFVCDLNTPLPYQSIGCVFSNAFFQHLNRDKRKEHLMQVRNNLAESGFLCYIGIPYFRNIAKYYLAGGPGTAGPKFDLYNVYRYTHGDPEHELPENYLAQLHKSLFDEEEVEMLLNSADFHNFLIFTYAFPGDYTEISVTMGFFALKSDQEKNVNDLISQCREFLDQFNNKYIRINTIKFL